MHKVTSLLLESVGLSFILQGVNFSAKDAEGNGLVDRLVCHFALAGSNTFKDSDLVFRFTVTGSSGRITTRVEVGS